MSVHQGEIVKVPVILPQGIEPHPALVISNDFSNEYEGTFVAIMISNIEIKSK